ncbi:MAG: DUF5666 domain-containing protein, partial [Deferrisomatales bacterium]
MRKNAWFWLLTGAAALALLAGCGGGGGGGSVSGGGVGGSGTSVGTISGFGSVIVNGVRFETQGAELEVENELRQQRVEDALRVGMVVRVQGTVNDDGTTGTATRVSFDDDLKGPVDNISGLALGQLGVLGQTVLLDDLTVFQGVTAGTIAVGDTVEASGFFDAQGQLHATFIEKKLPAAAVELKGLLVAAADTTAKTFRVGNQVVSYTPAVLRNVTEAGLTQGLFVEVKGTLSGGQLVATQVEPEDRRVPRFGQGRVEMEGVVTAALANGTFQVGGQPVRLAEGVSATGVVVGVRVKVRGTLGDDGVVVAQEVLVRLPRNVKIEGDVSARGAGSVTVFAKADGTGGITVGTEAATQMRDKTADTASPFPPLGGLRVGDEVRIRAFQRDGAVIAAKIERDQPQGRVRLQGPVAAIASPGFQILGVAVDTSGVLGVNFRQADDSSFGSSAAFFAALANGTLVKVTGSFSAATGVIAATEVEIELPNQNELEFELESELESENESQGRNRGTVDRFGSIFVNGQKIDTRGAAVRIKDDPATERELAVGMEVEVHTRIDDATGRVRATRVEVEHELQGPITAATVVMQAGTGTVMDGTV